MTAFNAGYIPPLSTGFFPQDLSGVLLDNSRMNEADSLLDRIDARLAELKLSDRAVSEMVTGRPDLIRDMRRRGSTPRSDTLARLAEVLQTSPDWLLRGELSRPYLLGDKRMPHDAGAGRSFLTSPARDLPVYGSALGADIEPDEHGTHQSVEAHILELTEAIEHMRRPPSMEGRRDVYALYISGSSMEPRYEPGDPVLVDPKRPVGPGDDVIVQLRRGTDEYDDQVAMVLIKRFLRRTPSFVELRQYNPQLTFTVTIDRIVSMHRVVRMGDLLG